MLKADVVRDAEEKHVDPCGPTEAHNPLLRLGRLAVSPHVFFLIVAGLNAVVLAFMTPPFQVHDEFQHFFRSYQISEGRLYGSSQDGRAGGVLPSSLSELVLNEWGTLEIWTVPKLRPHPIAVTLKALDQPLNQSRRTFSDFSGAAPYSPLPYTAQAVAIALGRALNLSPLGLLYCARFANALLAVSLIALGIRLLPHGRMTALAIALLPIAEFEYGSAAPDAGIIAAAFLFTALTMRVQSKGEWSFRSVFVAIFAGVIFCSIKIVYAPLLLCGLPAYLAAITPRSKLHPRAVRGALTQLSIAAIVIGLSLAWLKSNSHLSDTFLTGTRTHDEVHFISTHPIRYAMLSLQDIRRHLPFYVMDSIGIFGAWQVFLPQAAYSLAICSLGLSLLLDGSSRIGTGPALVWNLGLFAGTLAAIQLAMAVLNNAPGDQVIHGVQGRYFLPCGALAAAALSAVISPRPRSPLRSGAYALLLCMLLAMTVVTDVTLCKGFGLFA